MQWMLVAVGGGLGAALRFGTARMAARMIPSDFPLAILSINVVGSFLMGCFVGVAARLSLGEPARLFVAVGVLGGFTTFSSFSLDAVTLIERGQWSQALLYAVLSVVLAIGGLMAGLMLARAVG